MINEGAMECFVLAARNFLELKLRHTKISAEADLAFAEKLLGQINLKMLGSDLVMLIRDQILDKMEELD